MKPTSIYLYKGPKLVQQLIACGKCWQCERTRQDDYIGRCMCEAAYSSWCYTVTLTYADGPDRLADLAHRVLTPSHFQKFIRSLRRRGLQIRYFACGEYGDAKGRAHFHAILFGQGADPGFPLEIRSRIDAWPHGLVQWKARPGYDQFRYVVKYLLKRMSEDKWFSLSTKPPLGHLFFQAKAAQDAALGLVSANWRYTPPGQDALGKTSRTFLMSGVSRRNYLLALMDFSGLSPVLLAKNRNEAVQDGIALVDFYLRTKAQEEISLEQFTEELGTHLFHKAAALRSNTLDKYLKSLPWLYPDGYTGEPHQYGKA